MALLQAPWTSDCASSTTLLPLPLPSASASASTKELCISTSSSSAASNLNSSALSPRTLYADSFDRPLSSRSLPAGGRFRKNVKEMTGFATTEEEFEALPIAVRRKVRALVVSRWTRVLDTYYTTCFLFPRARMLLPWFPFDLQIYSRCGLGLLYSSRVHWHRAPVACRQSGPWTLWFFHRFRAQLPPSLRRVS